MELSLHNITEINRKAMQKYVILLINYNISCSASHHSYMTSLDTKNQMRADSNDDKIATAITRFWKASSPALGLGPEGRRNCQFDITFISLSKSS